MKSGSQGTRVESRGDGAKVHRYFSGSPERKRQGMANPAKAAVGGEPNEIVDYFD
jgi:hypothetical protein